MYNVSEDTLKGSLTMDLAQAISRAKNEGRIVSWKSQIEAAKTVEQGIETALERLNSLGWFG